MFQKAIFDSISGNDPESHPDELTDEAVQAQETLSEVSPEELVRIQYWAKILKIAMMIISTLMIVTGLYNVLSSSTSVSVSTLFLALYVFFFAVMICCFECGLKAATMAIVQNFGFMYNPIGRFFFMLFVAFLCYELSVLGKICFALLIVELGVQLYVYATHPYFATYMQKLHYYDKVRPGLVSTVQ